MDDSVQQPSQPPAGPKAARTTHPWRLLGLAAAVFFLLGVIGGEAVRMGLSRFGLVAVALGTGVGFVAVSIAMVGLIVQLPLSWKRQLWLAIGLSMVSAAAKIGGVRLSGNLFLELIGDLCLFVAATLFGMLASRMIREQNILVPVAVAAAAVDTFGVYWGPVAEITRRAPQFAKHLSAAVPGSNIPSISIPQLSYVGVGDFLFMGLFVAVVYRLGMNRRRTLWALFIAFLTVPGVFALTTLKFLPGLVFVGIAVVIANWRHFRFSRAEKFALLYAAVAVAALIVLVWGLKKALG
jgi:hypothetical protein